MMSAACSTPAQAAGHSRRCYTRRAIASVLHGLHGIIVRHLARTKASVRTSGAVATMGFDTMSGICGIISDIVGLPVDRVLHAVFEAARRAELPLANTGPDQECKTDRTSQRDKDDNRLPSDGDTLGGGSRSSASRRFFSGCGRAGSSNDNGARLTRATGRRGRRLLLDGCGRGRRQRG